MGSCAHSAEESANRSSGNACVLEDVEDQQQQEAFSFELLQEEFAYQGQFSTARLASGWSLSNAKRVFDLAIALPTLIIAAVPMGILGICVRLSSIGPAIFVQERVGRHGVLFRIFKFRSMRENGIAGSGLTKEGDPRITPLGRWMRKFKLDELPQLYNVLRGDLSLVGPRPKLPQYEVDLKMEYRPGITGVSTLLFRNEEKILSSVSSEAMEDYYERFIKPLKARIDARYMRNATFWSDLKIIMATILCCFLPDLVASVSPRKVSGRITRMENRSKYGVAQDELLQADSRIPASPKVTAGY